MQLNEQRAEHPFDRLLAERSLLGWFAPTVELLLRQAVRIAPFAAALALYAWLAPHIALAGPFDDSWRAQVDSVLRTVALTAIMAFGYVVLVRAEGGPHGLGATVELPQMAQRLAVVALIFAGLIWLLGAILPDLFSARWLTQLLMYGLRLLGIWALYLVFWLFSPLIVMLAVTQTLCYVRAIRSDEPLMTLVPDSFRRVFGQWRRFVVPALLISGVLILLLHALTQAAPVPTTLQLISQWGAGIRVLLAFLIGAWALSWWFVTERALCPEVGADGESGLASIEVPAGSTGPFSPLSAHAPSSSLRPQTAGGTPADPMALTAASMASVDAPLLAEEIAELEREHGPLMAARRLVAALRGRRLTPADYADVCTGLTDTSALPALLAALAVDWQPMSRPGELAFVVGEGLRLDRQFLMDRPDQVLVIAKRLSAQEQPELAARLLLPFLDRHRGHSDHAEAGVQMARVLAFQRDKPEAALRLLRQLAGTHADHPAITALIRQLEH